MLSLTPVTSSNINAVGYDTATEKLYVQFKHGGLYEYDGVPAEEYEAMLTAGSVGSYFNDNIKDAYAYRRT